MSADFACAHVYFNQKKTQSGRDYGWWQSLNPLFGAHIITQKVSDVSRLSYSNERIPKVFDNFIFYRHDFLKR